MSPSCAALMSTPPPPLLLLLLVLAAALPARGAAPLLWPWPQETTFGTGEIALNPASFDFVATGFSNAVLEKGFTRYKALIFGKSRSQATDSSLPALLTQVAVFVRTTDVELQLEMNEKYTITLEGSTGKNVIEADTIWGALRGLETFSQLVVQDATRGLLIQSLPLAINDWPRFPHRGLLIDTSRNFLTLPAIFRTIDGLAFTKMNVLHWHIVDSQSFPFVSKSFPLLSQKGAYSPEEIYTPEDVSAVVQYAYERGVRVIPEFDGPGHSYAWGLGYPNITLCPDSRPWSSYCLQPPCGQLDPSQEFTYDLLKGLLRDVSEVFIDNYLHLGADEVNFPCWELSDSLSQWMERNNYTNYKQVLQYYVDRVVAISAGLSKPAIFWQEVFNDDIQVPKETIIQVWLDSATLRRILVAGYRGILSNYQDWYLDCGFGDWLGGGDRSWCDPLKGWKTMYLNEPEPAGGDFDPNLLIGGEACMWGESNDDTTIDNKIWPRAAAVGERLWSARTVNDPTEAFPRIDAHRYRLVKRGINASVLRPKWCTIDEDNCPPS